MSDVFVGYQTSDRVYYGTRNPGVRVVFRTAVVRVEEKHQGGWRRRDSFDLLSESEEFLNGLR